jgi:hypothetical protein
MNKSEFHKPFIKTLVFIAIVTVLTMGSSRFLVHYYGNKEIFSQKTMEYSSHKSQVEANALSK